MNAEPITNTKLFSWGEFSTGIIGALTLSLFIIVLVCWLNLNKSRHTYDLQAASIMQLMSQRLAADRAILMPLATLYQANATPNDRQLSPISKMLLAHYPYFSNLAYLRWLNPDERLSYIDYMHKEGFPQFHIHPLANPKGDVPKNQPVLIVSFIEPQTHDNISDLGADLLSNSHLAATIKYVSQINPMTSINIPNFNGMKFGYLDLMATYPGIRKPNDLIEQHPQLTGMFMAAINFQRIFSDLLAIYPQWDISIHRVPETKPGSLIADHIATPQSMNWLPIIRIKHNIQVNDQRLRIDFTRHTTLSDLGLGSALAAAFLPWILIGGLIWITWLRRHTKWTQLAAEREIAHSREQAEIALSSISDAVITTDSELRVRFMNPSATQLTGWPMALAIGRPLVEIAPLLEEGTQSPLKIDAEQISKHITPPAMEGLLLARGGHSHAVEIRLSRLTHADATSEGLAVVLHDLSRERELETALDFQSNRDPLTGLLNRRSFENYLRQWLTLFKPGSSHGALCQIDLNHFKLINDTAGHRAGDELLRQFAWLLGTVLPATTVLSRLGADEFGILLPANTSESPQHVAQQLIEAARAFEFSWEQQHFNIATSIGLVLITDPGQDAGDLLVKADLACLAAKDKGRNNLHVYEPGDAAIAQRSGQMLWLTRLQEALRDDRFVLYMQPMLPLNTSAEPQEMHEFLVRMRLDDGTIGTPNLFIPAAERYQLMAELDRRIIDQALALVARCVGTAHDALYTINLSGQSVGAPHLANYIFDRLRHYGVRPRQICFEITETAAISNMHAAQALIRQLRSRGIRFALDDFGAGLSSFTYLKRLPVDFLKIEGEFVRGMSKDTTDRSLVESFCEIGRAFGLRIIAESVEDEGTLDMLREIGVDYVQGFHIAPPHPTPLVPTHRLNTDPGTSAV